MFSAQPTSNHLTRIHPESARDGAAKEKFSLLLFFATVVLTLAGLCGILVLVVPSVWRTQISASWGALAGVFLVTHFAAAFVEFFFHRYVLHAPLVPFLSYFYRQHTLHHALTRVSYRRTGSSRGELPCLVEVENRYPIVESKQHEASFFPWYSLAVFSLLGSLVFAPLQWLMPQTPVFLGGYVGIAWSLTLYELIHAAEHLPPEWWNRRLEHPARGRFWRRVYAFHIRHHADIRCNEAISGVFGLPLVDLLFGTYLNMENVYPHGRPVDLREFASPQPRFGFIRWLDRAAEKSIQRRREGRRSEKPAGENDHSMDAPAPGAAAKTGLTVRHPSTAQVRSS